MNYFFIIILICGWGFFVRRRSCSFHLIVSRSCMLDILLIWRRSRWLRFFDNRGLISYLFWQRGSAYNFFSIFFGWSLSIFFFCIINYRGFFYIRRFGCFFYIFTRNMWSYFFSIFSNFRIFGLFGIMINRRNICYLFFIIIYWRRNACLLFIINICSFGWYILCFFSIRRWSILCIIFILRGRFVGIFNFRSHRFFCI